MTSATLHLTAPTHTEVRLLRLADTLTLYVERRVARRAERRALVLDRLREQQTPTQDSRSFRRALAQLDIPRF
jgi:anion-transporting  ArsA/GET3 family ATPase